jgi:tyrosyl-tRNA synthetase
VQFGVQDQLGNIIAGIDLTRRAARREVHGATFPLLLKSDGEKFGKTAGGAVWLDANRTSPYDYFQFWRNAEDGDVGRLLAFFTGLPVGEVRRLSQLAPPKINRAKEILAFEATALAHGADEAEKAYRSAGAEFGFADPKGEIETSSRIRNVAASAAVDDLPTHGVAPDALAAGIWIVKLLADSGLCTSNGDARRKIRGGGCYLNNQRVGEDSFTVDSSHLCDGQIILRVGKKNVRRIVPTG